MADPELSSSTEPLDPVVEGGAPSGSPEQAGVAPSIVGSTLAGRFRVLRLVDRGSSGDLYEGRDLFLEASTAIAVLPAQLARDPRAVEALRRQVLQARRVAHAAVCRLHDLHQDLDRGVIFLSMEHLDGVTLASRLRSGGGLDAAEVLPILDQLAGGLAALQSAGITGGVLRASDVMLVRSGAAPRAVILPAALATSARASSDDQGATPGDGAWALAPLARAMVTAGPDDDTTERALPPGWSAALGGQSRGPEALARALRRATRGAALSRRLVLPALLALALIIGALLWRAADRQPPRPLLPSVVARVAIAPVRAAGALDPMAETLAAALRTELSIPGPVRACGEEETSVSLRRFPPARTDGPPPGLLDSLRTRANAASLLLLRASRTGDEDEVEVDLGLHRTTDERRVGNIRIRGPASRFPELARAMGDATRGLLALPALPVQDRTALSAMHPPSLDLAERLFRASQRQSTRRDAVQLLEPVVREAPDFVPGLDAYAEALLAAGRTQEASSILERAVRAASALPELFRLRIEGRSHAAAGNAAQVTRIEKRIFELVPEDLWAVLAPRGRSLEEQRKDLLALRSSGSFLALQPELDAREARLALMGSDPPAALEAVARGESKIPDFEDRDRRFQSFWWLKENALRQVGRYDEALVEDRMALEMARAENDQERVAELKLLTAATLHGLRRYESAVAELEEALALSRRGGKIEAFELSVLERMVYYLVDLGDLPRATRTLDEATARFPDEIRSSSAFLEYRLLIAIEGGRWPEAERHRRALQAHPDGEQAAQSTLLALARERDDAAEVARIHALTLDRAGLAGRFVDQYKDIVDASVAEDGMDRLPPRRWSEVPQLRVRTERHGSRSVAARLRSRVALGSGDLVTATAAADEALAEALLYPKPEAECLARLQLARVRLARGDAQGAEETLHPVDEVARRGSRRLELEAALVRADGAPVGAPRTGALRALASRASTLEFRRIARLALAKVRMDPPGSSTAPP